MNIMQMLLIKFPALQGVSYWLTQYDGTPWNDAYDGLVWENKDIPMPTKDEINQWMIDATILQQYTFSQNAITNKPVYTQLDEIDTKSIRPLRENDTARLATLASQAAALRAQLLPVN